MISPLFASIALAMSPQSASEVTFSGVGGLALSGTLLRPSSTFTGPRPAVLLLPGSGPTDRDGNQRPSGIRTDLLKQLAETLAKNGVASLRFDKRAVLRYRDAWLRL